MKKGWEYRKLENCLVKVPKQKELKTKDYKTFGQYPIVSQESTLISGYSDDIDKVFSHVKPVIIFGDHTKNVKYIDFDFVVGADGVKILMPQDDIISKFFYYVIKSFRLDNLGYARHYRLLKENIVPVPPLSEQQRIVSYLDSAFAKIDAVAKNAEKSLNEAKALFQSALTKMMEPKEGWEYKKLGDVLNLKRGYDLTHSQMKEGQIVVAGSNGPIGLHNEATPISPCITIGRSGSVGAVNIYEKCWAHNTTLYVDDFKGNYPRYLYYILKTMNLSKLNSGSSIPTLNRNFIHPMKIPFIKDVLKQKEIIATIDSLKSKVDQLQTNLTRTLSECAALKQSILRQTFE